MDSEDSDMRIALEDQAKQARENAEMDDEDEEKLSPQEFRTQKLL